MANVSELMTEIEEVRNLLNAIINDMGIDDCNNNILLDISTRMVIVSSSGVKIV